MTRPTEAAGGVGTEGVDIYDMAEIGEGINDPELDKRIAELFGMNALKALEAKYKIELVYTDERSATKPYGGFIVIWLRTGENESLVYLCSSKDQDNKPCNAPLTMGMISKAKGLAVCPRCRKVMDPKALTGQIYAKLPTAAWATLTTRVFGILGCNADIEINYIKNSIRGAEEASKKDGGVALSRMHATRDSVIYTLSRIVTDTSGGADVQSVIRAFIEA